MIEARQASTLPSASLTFLSRMDGTKTHIGRSVGSGQSSLAVDRESAASCWHLPQVVLLRSSRAWLTSDLAKRRIGEPPREIAGDQPRQDSPGSSLERLQPGLDSVKSG